MKTPDVTPSVSPEPTPAAETKAENEPAGSVSAADVKESASDDYIDTETETGRGAYLVWTPESLGTLTLQWANSKPDVSKTAGEILFL